MTSPWSYDIVPVQRKDLHRIVALWEESAEYHASLDPRFTPSPGAARHYQAYLHSVASRPDHHLRAARTKTEFLGFCLTQYQEENPIFPRGPVGFLSDIVVTRKAQRAGIGKALTEDALSWLRARGARSVQLTVAVANTRAQHFWRKTMGFEPYMDRLWRDL